MANRSPIPIVGGIGEGRSQADRQECINLYPSVQPGGSPQQTLLPTPGSKIQKIIDAGKPVRGLHSARGVLYAVIGDSLYAFADISPVLRGTIATSTGPVEIVDNGEGNQVAICDGDSLYVWEGTTITNVRKARSMTYQNRFLFISELNQSIIRWNEPGGNFKAWDESYYIAADAMPDGVLKVFSDHNEIWAFGEYTTEVFYQTTQADALLSVLPNGIQTQGIGAIDSVVSTDNTIFWLDNSKMVRKAEGYNPVIISDNAISFQISSFDRIDDAIGMSYKIENSTFYVLTFPSGGKTFTYDVGLGIWHQWSTGAAEGRHLANCITFYDYKYWVGGHDDGSLYTLDKNLYYDNQDPIRRVRSTKSIKAPDGNFVAHNRLEIETADGKIGNNPVLSSDPIVSVQDEPPTFDPPDGRTTDVGGQTWATNGIYRYVSTGTEWIQSEFIVESFDSGQGEYRFDILLGGDFASSKVLRIQLLESASDLKCMATLGDQIVSTNVTHPSDNLDNIKIFNEDSGTKIFINDNAFIALSPEPNWPVSGSGNMAINPMKRRDYSVINSGRWDTVGVQSDGTCLSVGLNFYGQLNIGAWTNIVSIDTGVGHTIGLKSDGTLLGIGYNNSGQINIGSWAGITSIACGSNTTIGLKSDGTCVAVGDNSSGQANVSGFASMVGIASGDVHTVGVRSGGSCAAVGASADGRLDVGGWENIIAISAGSKHTVGLKNDGTCVATGDNSSGQLNISGFNDIIAISCGGFHTVGLKNDGTVLAVGYNNNGQTDVAAWENIESIGTGVYTTFGTSFDGSAIAVGDNNHGQINVGTWSGMKSPNEKQAIIHKVASYVESATYGHNTIVQDSPPGDNPPNGRTVDYGGVQWVERFQSKILQIGDWAELTLDIISNADLRAMSLSDGSIKLAGSSYNVHFYLADDLYQATVQGVYTTGDLNGYTPPATGDSFGNIVFNTSEDGDDLEFTVDGTRYVTIPNGISGKPSSVLLRIFNDEKPNIRFVKSAVAPPEPSISMQYSNDEGDTWKTLKPRKMGVIGKWINRLKWNGLGRARTRIYRFVTESPVAIEIINAWVYLKEGRR